MSGAELSPAWTLVFGAALVPLLRGAVRGAWTVLLPLAGLAQLWFLAPGEYGQVAFLGQELLLVRVDRWSTLFGAVFLIAALLNSIYALHVRDAVQPAAGLAYAGAALGAVFAGDLLTLFVFWELTAITSVFLIWARPGERSYRAGLRYLIVQLVSGMLLLLGALQQLNATGSLRFEHIGLDGPGGWLIFLGFGIKCAFPLLHNWLQDAYPEATESGTVMLSAFTTKLAVYALARGFAGQPELIWIGAAMTAFPIFYAVIENDLRRVLAYSLNNQLGFMVVGIGVGTELALNGTAAHAFTHIIYKGLLFMSMGAVLLRTGTVKASELGGLYKSMPWTTGFCVVGAASIAAFPLFSGFVSKSMILSAAGHEGQLVAFLVLLFASAAMFHPDAKDAVLRVLRARLGPALRRSAMEHAGRHGARRGAVHRSSACFRSRCTRCCRSRWTTRRTPAATCCRNCSCSCSPRWSSPCCCADILPVPFARQGPPRQSSSRS